MGVGVDAVAVCRRARGGLRESQVRACGGFAPSPPRSSLAGMSIVDEEIFGPVVVAEAFDNTEELVRRANTSKYGLAAGIWTRDIAKAHRVASQLRAGMAAGVGGDGMTVVGRARPKLYRRRVSGVCAGTVWINTYNVFDAALPFGGYKQSGWGREMGPEAMDLYTEVKSVVIGL